MENKPLPVGTTLKERYRITRLVAGGGMAWVYEVEELRASGPRQIWAMKELRADADDVHTIEEGRKLFAEFEKEYGKPQSAEHYSALTLVAYAAMDEAIRSGKDVKDYLYNTTFHKYVNNYSFDKNGDVVSDSLTYTLKVLKEQAPVPYLMEGTSAALKEK